MVKRYCENCDEETFFQVEFGDDFSDVDDDELDQVSWVSKANGDSVTTYTCMKCYNVEEEL